MIEIEINDGKQLMTSSYRKSLSMIVAKDRTQIEGVPHFIDLYARLLIEISPKGNVAFIEALYHEHYLRRLNTLPDTYNFKKIEGKIMRVITPQIIDSNPDFEITAFYNTDKRELNCFWRENYELDEIVASEVSFYVHEGKLCGLKLKA